MSKKLLNAIESESNFTLTENLATARATTGSELLNFFSVAGALRTREESDIRRLFDSAFAEDPQYALKAAFYFRDIRGGQGERRTFRAILKYLAESPETKSWLSANLHLIPEYGRWDDLFVLFDTPVEIHVLNLIQKQLQSDVAGKTSSLLAKWLPSENASSKESKHFAYRIMKHMLMTPRSYRKLLAAQRKRIDVLERKLSANKWSEIEYEKVPSQANLLYRSAFRAHDEERYLAFLESVKKGEKKIHSGVLFPYDIVRKCLGYELEDTEQTLDALWENLPDYFEGKTENSLVVCDVSGSMFMSNNSLPAAVAISLAVYAAERNKGIFHNKFITFSAAPELQTIKGTTIVKKVANLKTAHWDANTNVEAVFDLLLQTAIRHKLSNDDMVKKLYIISDMEFDQAAGDYYSGSYSWRPGMPPNVPKTLFQTIGKKYEKAGYDMPELVFWNVDSRNDQFPMSMDERGFVNVSGCSPSIFTSLLKSKFLNAYDLMIEVLDQKRYEPVSFIGY